MSDLQIPCWGTRFLQNRHLTNRLRNTLSRDLSDHYSLAHDRLWFRSTELPAWQAEKIA